MRRPRRRAVKLYLSNRLLDPHSCPDPFRPQPKADEDNAGLHRFGLTNRLWDRHFQPQEVSGCGTRWLDVRHPNVNLPVHRKPKCHRCVSGPCGTAGFAGNGPPRIVDAEIVGGLHFERDTGKARFDHCELKVHPLSCSGIEELAHRAGCDAS